MIIIYLIEHRNIKELLAQKMNRNSEPKALSPSVYRSNIILAAAFSVGVST